MSIVRQIMLARALARKTAWLLSRDDEERRLAAAWRDRMRVFSLRNQLVKNAMKTMMAAMPESP